ncbi:gallidermin family lantibiotic [Candidatus Protochlamydia sp. W-9]|uniref:gallidermin family lantibiotic n=1 Tax=Candidatus Protochlamydia sp. W-9 TaxID=1785087 RepID=UPI0009ABEFB3|nr:gallidermin family lantibiotic [Candidatus Protochlamydia sp. W-9]
MKITNNIDVSAIVKQVGAEHDNDPFDIDVKVINIKEGVNHNQNITSKSLCTPGCGKTGTGNSFCC